MSRKNRLRIRALGFAVTFALVALAGEPALREIPAFEHSAKFFVAQPDPLSQDASRLGILEEIQPEWLGDAKVISREVLADLLIYQPRNVKKIVKEFDEGFRLPMLEEVRLRVRKKQIVLEYQF